MELTRFKRFLRSDTYPVCTEVLALFDALDQIQEDAQTHQEHIRNGSTPTEEELLRFLQVNTDEVIRALLNIPSVGREGALCAIILQTSYEQVLNVVEEYKRQKDTFDLPGRNP